MTRRREFPTSVRVAALSRCGGLCDGCGHVLRPGRFHFDHVNPDGLTGKPTLENCRVLCTNPCHLLKTRRDIAAIAQAKRREAIHLGAKAPSPRPFPKRRKVPLPKVDKLPLPPRRGIFIKLMAEVSGVMKESDL